ncbi:MAG: hypothetical protein QOK43_1641, partial [Acidimicrobiaceae bacterium]|nr:hypothetical protein [Acidimicrobiaceae bacterium]
TPATRATAARPGGRPGDGTGSRSRLLLAVGLIVLVVAVLALVASRKDSGSGNAGSSGGGNGSQSASGGGDGACKKDSAMDHYSDKDKAGVVHTDAPGYAGPLSPRNNPSYSVNPPSGGDHLSFAESPGTYEGQRVPLDGNLVHSLEHGYVIIWFRPDISDADKATLESVRQLYPRDTLVVERRQLDKPVAATAWHQRLLCGRIDKTALANFVRDARNKAPERIPH